MDTTFNYVPFSKGEFDSYALHQLASLNPTHVYMINGAINSRANEIRRCPRRLSKVEMLAKLTEFAGDLGCGSAHIIGEPLLPVG